MRPDPAAWLLIIAALAVALPPIILTLKGIPMSDAFKSALANLVAAFTNHLGAKQAELDAANARANDLQTRLDALDAEATAEVVAATPAATA